MRLCIQRPALLALALTLTLAAAGSAKPQKVATPRKGTPIYVAVQWHMHQPIYWPYEDIVATSRNPNNTLDVLGILSWPDRVGAYTRYPVDSVAKFLDLPHAGAQVSFSGSLVEDIQAMAQHGIAFGLDWPNRYREARTWKTRQGNARFDLVGFGYYHPLMAFLEYDEIRAQVDTHRDIIAKTFGGPPSRGLFPPENAFTTRMVPALVDSGYEWVLVDNIHMDRASKGYPYAPEQKIAPPNAADQLNPAQKAYVSLTSQTNTLQAVGRVGLLPHWVEYRDPATGKAVTPAGKPSRMIVVPTERSLGYDDSYGDRSPIPRLEQLASLNDDPRHPLLIVLAHDGDNFGASGSRYYLETMNWVRQNPDQVVFTTIQDYLDMFPPEGTDVIHVEDGSWAGADLGDATFGKWLGPPYRNGVVDFGKGWSSDWDSWASIVAARNWVQSARKQAPSSPATARAERYFHVGLTSCYWYWDGQKQWDMKPTMAANEAVKAAREALGGKLEDRVGPAIFTPQRDPYNPGFAQTGGIAPSAFSVYTLVGDAGGVARVTLKVKSHEGLEALPSDFTYEGQYRELPMTVLPMQGQSAIPALAKADRYAARVTGQEGKLVAYYVEAQDPSGNTSRSEVRRVAVGNAQGGGDLAWSPAFPRQCDAITFKSAKPAALHWGVNGWKLPPKALWPKGSTAWADGKAAETPMTPADGGGYTVTIPATEGHGVETIEFVFHNTDNTWGRDQLVTITDPMKIWRTSGKRRP